MNTNKEFKCDDVNCMFKYSGYGISKYAKPNTCKLNNNIAKQVFDDFGVTTCELGLGQANLDKTEMRKVFHQINQMIKEERANGDL
jgi:hypothetical protein